ncbi:hypothetical protein P3S67_022216 [Capsicum chacoense]
MSAPLGDWIRLLLRNSEFVSSRGKGSKNVLAELKNVKDLRLAYCDSLDIHCQNNIPFPKLERLKVSESDHLQHLFCLSLVCPDDEEEGISRRTHMRPDVIKFPNLYRMELGNLGCFNHFCKDTVEGVEFSLLREMQFGGLPEFQNFWPTDNNAITYSNPLFNEKVSCPNLEVLSIWKANSITALCSHQLPMGYFNKLEKLTVRRCGGLRNLMSPLVAKGLLNLRTLLIQECQSMEEVITKEEQQGEEIMTNEPLFLVLDKLILNKLPKLGHFILTKHTLEFPFLRALKIHACPEMKTFVQQGSVSTLSLKSVNNDDEVKVVDTMFNSKVSCPNLEVLFISGAVSITALCSHQLPTAYFSKLESLEVKSCAKLRKLMSLSVARGLLNLRTLSIKDCRSMEEVITEEEQQGEEITCNEPLCLRLEVLKLNYLMKHAHFILTKHALEFSFLKNVAITVCPKMKAFIQQGSVSITSLEIVNDDDELKVVDLNKAMFDSKVSCPNLEVLQLHEANSISGLCSHQFSTAYFGKLKELDVRRCGELRNLMSTSVARGLLNLQTLSIRECQSMEEVTTEEERKGEEIMTNEPLFPMLDKLILDKLPKLRHFFLTKRTLEFPFLRTVKIHDCHGMKTFVQQESVSISSLKSVNNETMFNSKVSCPNLEVLFISSADSITALCSHQLPTAYFNKLETLKVDSCEKLRNLMSPSVARGLLNL